MTQEQLTEHGWVVNLLGEDGTPRRVYGKSGMTAREAQKLCAEKAARYPRLAFEVALRDWTTVEA